MSTDAEAAERTQVVEPLAVSQRLLRAVRVGEPTEAHEETLAGLSEAAVTSLSDETGMAFWLNVYNAGTQLLMERREELYGSMIRFFRATAITVAGTELSLDAIEHGIIRDGAKYGLGYLPRVFGSSFERRHRLGELDPRVHFALNCGAVSCPPIAAYSEAVDSELDLAADGYLNSAVSYDETTGVASVPRVCLWYRGDFGGPAGVIELLRQYDVVPADDDVSISYKSWDWSSDRGNFADWGF